MTIKKNHEYFLELAYKQALKAKKLDEVPVGCVIVHNGKVISRGYNIRESKNSVLGHAEAVAVTKATKKLKSWRLIGCDVYITLEPCAMCAGIFWQARVKNVYFGAFDKKGGALSLGFNLHNHQKLNHRYGLMCFEVEKHAQILSDFFRNKRKKHASC